MQRYRLAVVRAFILVLAAGVSWAQTKAPQDSAPGVLGARGSVAASAAGAPDDEDNDADIPPIARGRISESEYLRLRGQQVGMQRGVDDLARNPQARSQAIRKMEIQEQFLRRTDLGAATSGSPPLTTSVPAWAPLGPDPIPNGQTINSEVPVSGRVTAVAVDPSDPAGDTVYVGTAQGGLYRSLDGGVNWVALMDSAQSLAIGALTLDPTDPTVLFVGTGEGNLSLDSFFGVGLYIITGANSGSPTLNGPFNTPTVSPNPDGFTDVFTGRSITRILVNPANHSQILVSTSSGASGASGDIFSTLPTRGVYLSTNVFNGSALGTPTFQRLTVQTAAGTANRPVTDMVMDPVNPNLVLVNVYGLLSGTEGGIWASPSAVWAGTGTWTQTMQTTTQVNGKFAVNSSTATTTFFVGLDQTPSTGACTGKHGTLFEANGGGISWIELPAARGFCGGQCFYDMPVAVDPTNANNIYIGGQAGSSVGACGAGTMGKSTDGGATFNPSQSSLHADSHAIAIFPANPSIIYTGNDGGIFRSNDAGATWISLNNPGFTATQFESLAVHPKDPNFTIGGTQDNGTPFLQPDGVWTRADFGDGGFSAIDQNATDTTNVTMYHTYFNLKNDLVGFVQVTSVSSARDGQWNFFGCNGTTPGNGITCSDTVLFYAPLALGPGKPNTVYYGTDRLYHSADSGMTNTVVSQMPIVAGVPISAIGISPQDDNVRIVGLQNGQVWATTSGSTTLTNVTGTWTAKYIARAVIDPNTKTTAYVTLDGYGVTGGHVWKTTNLSAVTPTWSSASTGLPDVPVNAFAVDPANSNNLYAGTDIGVYNSTDGGNTWNPYGTGLPRVAVFDLKLAPGGKIRIATHGRGMWETAAVGFSDDTTTLTTNPAHISPGDNVTLTATVNHTGNAIVPTGTISFFDGATPLTSPVTLDVTGAAPFSTTSLSSGLHTLTAVYSGDGTYRSSTSTAAQVVVGLLATSISLVASPANPAPGATVTLTATLNTGGSLAVPTGTVTFSDGTTSLGTKALLDTTVATLSTSFATLGAHSITAQYSGDTTYVTSASPVAVVNVGSLPPDYSLTIPSGTVTVMPGQPATYTINVGALNGFTGTVSFSCTTGLPALTSCSFNPGTVSGSGATMLTINTTAPTAAPPASGSNAGLGGTAGFFGLVLFGGLAARKRLRRWRPGFLMLAVLSLSGILVSCGGGGSPPVVHNPGTPPGTSTVTITATSGNTAHTATVTLVVQ